MIPQSAQSPEFSSALASHFHFNLETCPTCGQEIPPDKLEEISGRIAARERQQTLAITAQLERQFAAEKARADAKAKADLELERQQGAVREARVREEAQEAAEKLVSQKEAEAEQARLELVAGWKRQLADAESARESAEEMKSNLQAEMKELREANATALEAMKTEAKEREIEIRNEAKQTADSAAAERIASIEAARHESEARLQTRINDADASRIAAEQKESALALQLDELRNASEDEVAKVKEEAAAEAVRIRQAADEATERAVAEANAKARGAEGKVSLLAEQHASALKENLDAQREILEKAKDDAVNAERARAFEETQKLSTKVNDLQRALERKTADELGEGAEIDFFEALRTEFPDDRVSRIAKGSPGADILHVVMLNGKECGTIVYDSKNRNKFEFEYVAKLKADQLAAKADHAILSTNKFPKGKHQLHIHDGVLLANPARVVSVVAIVRQHLLQLHTLRLSDIERESKTAALYEFITSERCLLLLGRIDERADDLLQQQTKEVRWHENNWKKQGEAIRAIQKAKADLANQICSIIGTSANDIAMSEAS
jgi:hypothetical protein